MAPSTSPSLLADLSAGWLQTVTQAGEMQCDACDRLRGCREAR